MFSEEDYFYGQRKYTQKFDKLSEFASSLFGDITQCAIVEVHKSGDVCWVANRPDFAEAHFEHKRHCDSCARCNLSFIPKPFQQ